MNSLDHGKFNINSWLWICVLCWAILFSGCTEPSIETDDQILLRVGGKVATMREFKQAFEMAKAAYSPAALRKPELLEKVLYDVLSQLTDELVISNRADELNISVTEDELHREVESIQSDYPDDAFDLMLIEQSITFSIWKEKFKTRLLLEKVIKRDLTDRQKISTSDISTHVVARQDISDGKINETAEGVMDELRQRKAQETYDDWISELRDRYVIYVDEELWEALTQ